MSSVAREHPSRPRLAGPLAAVAGFALGSVIGVPVLEAGVVWVRDYMLPAFVELYASGIAFCG